MSRFSYEAIKTDGTRINGEIEASNRSEAHRLLQRQKLQPLQINLTHAQSTSGKNKSADSSPANELPAIIRLSRNQVIFFTEELSDLLEGGIQLEMSLKIIEERQASPIMRALAQKLRISVRDGNRFSEALRNTSPSFGDLYCNLVSAAELSGALPQILKRQVNYLNVMQDLRAKIIQALIYPSFIVSAGALMLVLFMMVLVPPLTEMLTKSERALPLPTRILIGTSDFLLNYWWLLALVITGIIIGFLAIIRSPGGRQWWDEAKLKLPLFGPVLTCGFLAQFCQTLANLLSNGLPLLNGLKLLERAIGNVYLKAKLLIVVDIVGEGGSLSGALKRVGGFPDLFVDLVSIGEQTGELAPALEKAAGRYEKDMNRRIQRLTSLIQPIMICVIAGVVFIVIYSILTSIFEAMAGMRGTR